MKNKTLFSLTASLIMLLSMISSAYAEIFHGAIADSALQAPILVGEFDPTFMNPATTEVVVQVNDNDAGDILRVVFIGSDCAEVNDIELGEETPLKIFSFLPGDFVQEPVKIFVLSVDSTQDNIVNNPIMGTMYIGTTGSEVNMNLIGVLPAPNIASKDNIAPCTAGVCPINFNNVEFSLLPHQAMNTYVLTDPANIAITQLTARNLYNIFEPTRTVGMDIFADEEFSSPTQDQSCAGGFRLDNTVGFSFASLTPTYNVLGHSPIFEETSNVNQNLAVLGYSGGGSLLPDPNTFNFGTSSFWTDTAAGPKGPFNFRTPPSPPASIPTGAFERANGFQDNHPEAMAVTSMKIEAAGPVLIEDWFAITNPNQATDTYHVQFFGAEDCREQDFEIPVTGFGTQFVRTSDITGSLVPTAGAVIVTSQNGNDFIGELYSVSVNAQTPTIAEVVGKRNALMSRVISSDTTSVTGTASTQGQALVNAITATEGWVIDVVNLAAINDPANKISQVLKLRITDEQENTQSLDLSRSGCLISLTPSDLNGLADQSAWPTVPEYISVTAKFASGDPMGMPVVLTRSNFADGTLTRIDPGFEAGESAFTTPTGVTGGSENSEITAHITAPTSGGISITQAIVQLKSEVASGITRSAGGDPTICTLETPGVYAVGAGETIDLTFACTTDPRNVDSYFRFTVSGTTFTLPFGPVT